MLENDIKNITYDVYPFHMPGHKRQKSWLADLYKYDITEIYGADDLHSPSGIIEQAQIRAANFFDTPSTLFLTGGSTCGLLAAISAAAKHSDKIAIGRNCHKAVYNAAFLNRLETFFIPPEKNLTLGCFGETSPESVADIMNKSGAEIVVVTSPTYEGIVSDIEAISKAVSIRGGILIVDSAHGAHLGLNDFFPKSARSSGADIVIESAHKTLPCLTGAALLHNCSQKIETDELQRQLTIFETSSPPYPIICSIDRFVCKSAESDVFANYVKELSLFYKRCENLNTLYLFGKEVSRFDFGKIVICCSNADITGFELKEILLREFKIELEMAMPEYAVAMTSPADTADGFERLHYALESIDRRLTKKKKTVPLFPDIPLSHISSALTDTKTEKIGLSSAVGRISAEFVYAYPPGIPIIAPGEIITAANLEYLKTLSLTGGKIYSSQNNFPNFMEVFKYKH